MNEITIIVPVYNGMPFVTETINSIVNQSFKDIGILIIDDGSTDKSYETLENIKDTRIRLIKRSNTGLCNTLNYAISLVNTKYLARIDQDDIAHYDRIEKQLCLLEKEPEYDCVFSLINRISENGKQFGFYKLENSSTPFFNYIPEKHGALSHSTLFTKTNFIKLVGGYNSISYPADDLDLLLRLNENGRIAVINQPLVDYRVHMNAFTFKYFHEMQLKTKYVLENYYRRKNRVSEIEFQVFMKEYKYSLVDKIKEKGKLCFRKGGVSIGNGYYLEGIIFLFFAFLLYPKFTLKRLFSISFTKK